MIKDDAGNPIETYTYGASRNRLVNENTSGRTYYAWGGSSPLVEYTEAASSSTPVWNKSYVYAGSRLLSTATKDGSGEKLEFHHPDRLGTTLVTNPAANTSFRQNTLPFGTTLGADSTDYTNQVFTSYDRSAATGLDYAVNRTYAPGQSRFTQVDPIGVGATMIGDPQSNNLYGYVRCMPVDFIDPSGLNMAAPGTSLGSWNPMGIAYYVDGMLSDARTAWGILGAGAGYIEFHSVAGLTVVDSWEERRNPRNEQWEYVSGSFRQMYHIWGIGGSESAIGTAGGGNREDKTDCEIFVNLIVSAVEYRKDWTAARSRIGAYFAALTTKYLSMEKTPVSGFQTELTAAGQDSDVYRHVTGSAASILLDGVGAVSALDSFRQDIQIWRNSRADEARSSKEGNRAGENVGALIASRIGGSLTAPQMRDKISNVLCDK